MPSIVPAEPAQRGVYPYATAAEVAEVDAAVAQLSRVSAPSVVSLVAGQADETPTVTNCTLSAETTIKRVGSQSHKLTAAGAVTLTATYTLQPGPVTLSGLSGVGFLVYIADATKVTDLSVELYNASTSHAYKFNSNYTGAGTHANVIVTGWNLLRWPPSRAITVGSPAAWGTFTYARVIAVTNAATAIYVQQVTAEIRPKASLLFISDGGYSDFDTTGYPDLLERGIPVTFAIDCDLIGNVGHLTEPRLAELAAENGNSVSFHGWDGSVTANMTAAQATRDTVDSIKWLAARGYTGRLWRAAWMQNDADQSAATDDLVLFNPHNGADNVERVHNWPPSQRYNLVRIALHGVSEANMDAWFTQLQTNHGFFVCYTHKVSDSGASNITPTEWAYFLSKLDEGLDGGWLEGVTMESLLAASGVKVQQGVTGGLVIDYPEPDGTTTRFQML